jgi:hypothetical protein
MSTVFHNPQKQAESYFIDQAWGSKKEPELPKVVANMEDATGQTPDPGFCFSETPQWERPAALRFMF